MRADEGRFDGFAGEVLGRELNALFRERLQHGLRHSTPGALRVSFASKLPGLKG